MPEYKLYYFPTRGKAEAIRLLFHYKGIPFEDVRLSDQEWVSKKSSVPFGQLPVLVEDGKQIAQSWAIMRHLAHKFGLDGKDEEERVFIDQVSELARDYLDSAILYLAVIFGFVEGDKETIRNEKMLPNLEKFVPYFERIIKDSGSGFVGRSGLSYVDFHIAEWMLSLYGFEKELLDSKYPILVQHFQRVEALPELQEYLSKRPQSGI